MTSWDGAPQIDAAAPGPGGWARAAGRGVPTVAVVTLGLSLLLLVRLLERPLFGLRRPWTPWITVGVCRAALALMGLRTVRRAGPVRADGAIVANHVSWLDILALNAAGPLYFVAKSEVAGWPGIGWLARATGTVFVVRDPRHAGAQRDELTARLRAGHVLCVFPEGTSTDGRRVLPFKTALFGAFFAEGLHETLQVQGATLAYHAPPGTPAAFYGWWGEMGLAPHLLRVLAARRQGRVDVVFHPPRAVRDAQSRKTLARAAEGDVRAGLAAAGLSAEAP